MNTIEMTSPIRQEGAIESGVALMSNGHHREAIRHFRAVLEYNPYDPLANYNCGIAHYSLGEYADAVSCYQTALHVLPDWIEV